jgi:hypothetical protein
MGARPATASLLHYRLYVYLLQGGEKASPSKSLDASAFHLDAYAGVTAGTEAAAARIGSNSQAAQRPSRQAAEACQ